SGGTCVEASAVKFARFLPSFLLTQSSEQFIRPISSKGSGLEAAQTGQFALPSPVSFWKNECHLPAISKQHDPDGLEDNPDVEEERDVFDIVEIVLQFLNRVLHRRAVAVIDLGPTGQPRLDQMALGVELNLFAQLLDEERSFGARPDEAHLAAQNIDKLRNLVNAGFANESADAGDARVAVLRPLRLAVFFGVLQHRAELDDFENATIFTDPFLRI